MINFKLKMVSSALASLFFLSVHANAAGIEKEQVVAEVIGQKNQVLAEDKDGKRRLLAENSKIFDGEHLMILENASVELQYLSSSCKVVHAANTLITIDAASQCAAGQQMAVGQGVAAGAASGGAASGGAAAAATTAAATTAAATTATGVLGSIGGALGVSGAAAAAVGAAVVGATVIGTVVAVENNDDDPASP